MIDGVYVSKDVTTNLLGGPKLQEKNQWLIFPPTNKYSEIDAIVADVIGKVNLIVDKNLMVDINT